jgi:hypothetical protein
MYGYKILKIRIFAIFQQFFFCPQSLNPATSSEGIGNEHAQAAAMITHVEMP